MANGTVLTCLVIAAVLIFVIICMNRETMTTAPTNPKLKMQKRPSLPPAVRQAPDTVIGSAADMGNIVYMEPVDPNLLQIAATGRTY